MSEMLRHFSQEYSARYGQDGPWTMPSSFNVVEGFLNFLRPFGPFVLLPEKEHLLDLESYLDWYTRQDTIFPLSLLRHVMEDDVAYIFEFGSSGATFPIDTGTSTTTMVSVGLVRSGPELSAILLGGEFPPTSGSDEVKPDQVPRGKERLAPNPDLSASDRFLPALPMHSRLILLTEFDLDASTYGRRYVMRDLGRQYQLLTDAEETMDLPASLALDRVILEMRESLDKYAPLFSTLLGLLALPAFFMNRRDSTVAQTVATKLNDHRRKGMVRKAGQVEALRPIPFHRTIQCLPTTSEPTLGAEVTLVPPHLAAARGFWKDLGPGQIGSDREGNQTVGRTWVTQTETWSARPPGALLIRRVTPPVGGAYPGYLYLARSPAHVAGLLKIGITSREPQERMSELGGATSAPLPFEVLWQWFVGDAPKLEKEVHGALKAYRVRDSREFFSVDLKVAVQAVERLLS